MRLIPSFIELVPNSIKSDKNIQYICEALQPEIDEVHEIINTQLFFSDLELLDEIILDYLLGECNINKSVDGIFIETKADKIAYIKNYIKLRKFKGTKNGIQYALRTLRMDAKLLEWFEYGGEPYWFKIEVEDFTQFSEERLRLIKAFINEYKNARSWYFIQIKNKYDSYIYSSAINSCRVTIKASLVI